MTFNVTSFPARSALLLPYTFVLMNWAAMKALYCFLRGSDLERLWSDDTSASRRPRSSLFPTRP